MATYNLHRTISHEGLHKTKTIAANSRREMEYKCQLQYAQWNEQWEKRLISERNKKIAEEKRAEKARIAANNEKAIGYAQKQTVDAEEAQKQIENMLIEMKPIGVFDFETLKDTSDYLILFPNEPTYFEYIKEPQREDDVFNPKPGIFQKLSKKKMAEFQQQNDLSYKAAHNAWENREQENSEKNAELLKKYNDEVAEWNKEKDKFIKEQEEKNRGIDEFKEAVLKGEPDAVVGFLKIILEKLTVPIDYENGFEAEYRPENRMIIMDIKFPSVENMPKLKSVAYIKNRQEFKETYFTDNQIQKKYDEAIYKIVLMYLDCAFALNKTCDLIDVIVLNGIIDTIDKSTGNDTEVCILSVREKREDFEKLNLAAIDPKTWFRHSKGVAAASIADVTPVQPIQPINKEDDRFIEGYSVIDSVNEGANLAAIDWQDFENLIREVFEQEFSSNGGEVKITQASRDGGVDAVIFDPDPIRGGKIIIQAKRYTNVVGVSAVRDLYGTLLNEGAMKGILVTTSYYGNDAYNFAEGKPLQLINGAQLLGLLEKHGHKARINLQEAKDQLKENNK